MFALQVNVVFKDKNKHLKKAFYLKIKGDKNCTP